MTTDELRDTRSEYLVSDLAGDVLLIGGYGTGNIGDEAILSGLLGNLSEDIDTLTVVTHDERETRALHGERVPESVTFRPLEPSPTGLLSQLVTNDAFVIGGGGIFSRYMGPYARKIPYYTLAAQTLGKPVHWTAVGVYPSTPASVMTVLKRTLNHSTSVSVRDPVSKRTLDVAGVKNVVLVPDPAVRLEPDRKAGHRRLADAGLDVDRSIVGIAARRVLDETTNARLQDAYEGVADHFADRGWQLAYLPFCRHPYEDVERDDEVCERRASRHDAAAVVQYEHPETLLGVVSHMDAMVATRLHSMIFAHVADVPFAAIEYAEKCSSLLEHYGRERSGVPLKDVTADAILERIERTSAAR